jgi:hypothetical protein
MIKKEVLLVLYLFVEIMIIYNWRWSKHFITAVVAVIEVVE